jgi:hypothetical protein
VSATRSSATVRPALASTLEEAADTLTLTGGRAAAMQSGLLPALVAARPGWLRDFAEGYFRYLGALPLIGVARSQEGAHRIGPWFAPGRLPLFRFAPPYLAASRRGQELRYAIMGGLLVRGVSGYIAFGQAPEGERTRVWVEVLEFWPRLGLGPLYILTEVMLHRLVTLAYLRRVAAGTPTRMQL